MTRERFPSAKSTCLTGNPPAKWLQDTGARFDMIDENNLVDHPETWTATVRTSKPFNILTGNGVTKVKDEIQLASAAMGEQVSQILLDHSPCRACCWLPLHGIGIRILLAASHRPFHGQAGRRRYPACRRGLFTVRV